MVDHCRGRRATQVRIVEEVHAYRIEEQDGVAKVEPVFRMVELERFVVRSVLSCPRISNGSSRLAFFTVASCATFAASASAQAASYGRLFHLS